MKVLRLSNNEDAQQDDTEYTIDVIHEQSVETIKNDMDSATRIIRRLVDYYQRMHRDVVKTLEDTLIKNLWKFYDGTFVSPYASVIFGYSITTHKAQGSTFRNIFVDASDILNNSNENEAMRCIYTAHTRGSNEIHVLV
jgi:hypothetical protein